eukprot:708530-Lingulodinium_polyedra.AAC.1
MSPGRSARRPGSSWSRGSLPSAELEATPGAGSVEASGAAAAWFLRRPVLPKARQPGTGSPAVGSAQP